MVRTSWLAVPVAAAGAALLYYVFFAPAAPAGGLDGASVAGERPAPDAQTPAPLPELAAPAPADGPGTPVAGPEGTADASDTTFARRITGTPWPEAAAGLATGNHVPAKAAPAAPRGIVRGRIHDHDGSDAGEIAVGAWPVKRDFDLVKQWRKVRDVVADLRAGRSRAGLLRDTTEKDGTYLLNLEAGRRYLLLAATDDLHAAQLVTAEQAKSSSLDLQMPAPAQVALSGRVRGHDGTPLAHARVLVGWKSGRQVEAVSRADGTFTMPRLYPYLQGPTIVRMEVREARHDTVVLELHCYDADHLRLAHDAGEVEDYDLRPIGRDTFHLDVKLAEPTADDTGRK